jgi:hypothetical protein
VLLNKSGYRNCYPLGLSTKTSGELAFDSGSLFVGEQHKYSRPLFEGAANRCVSLVNTRFEEHEGDALVLASRSDFSLLPLKKGVLAWLSRNSQASSAFLLCL